MEARVVTSACSFNPDKMAKNPLFESPHMFFDVYCLKPGQAQKVHVHYGSDKVYYVLSGSGHFTIGDQEATYGPGTAVMARSGQPHGIRNDGPDDLMALVVMAPKP
ncbi:MAG: Cupin domain [Cyanobacteria bacterium RYN_339]|nr:Cupin domain [Cyanobacteria bacterium RYN_339]